MPLSEDARPRRHRRMDRLVLWSGRWRAMISDVTTYIVSSVATGALEGTAAIRACRVEGASDGAAGYAT